MSLEIEICFLIYLFFGFRYEMRERERVTKRLIMICGIKRERETVRGVQYFKVEIIDMFNC